MPVWPNGPNTRFRIPPRTGRPWLDGTLARLTDIGADAEVDIVAPGTPLAELHLLSMAVIEPLAVEAGSLSPDQAAVIVERPTQPDFLSCGFVHIGVWGRRPEA